jgi:hypothetical protein
MGMFDQPKVFSEHFQEDKPFVLEEMREGNPIRTEYGVDSPTLLRIGGDWFSIFSQGIKNQLDRMDADDLPREVVVTRVPTRTSGQAVKVIVPVDDAPAAA